MAAARIGSKLDWLAAHLDEADTETLTGELHGLIKLRVGDYRVAYTVDRVAKVIRVHLIGHRGDIYDIDLDRL